MQSGLADGLAHLFGDVQGRLREIEVDQARQDVLRARNGWILATQDYERQLDRFKVLLGLPTDANIGLDFGELSLLASRASAALGLESGATYNADEAMDMADFALGTRLLAWAMAGAL